MYLFLNQLLDEGYVFRGRFVKRCFSEFGDALAIIFLANA